MAREVADNSYDLDYFEERLRSHFRELKESRASQEIVCPLHALEHGLYESEICVLKQCIREEICVKAPSYFHKLPWIIYAAEIGYQYSGDEYWQTFEEWTPGWNILGDRYLIREWYKEFADKYNAAEPTGRWADHFSIICWPITHAILPKDLQRQLAQLLYEARYSISADLIKNPPELGTKLASYCWQYSSRFQAFAQQNQLLGQISAALLLHKQADQCLIEPTTLDRITADLAEEQTAKSWLKEARKGIHTVVLKGLTGSSGKWKRISTSSSSETRSAANIGLAFHLRKLEYDMWSVILEMPDLSEIAAYVPECKAFLRNSRCKIHGSRGLKARGWLVCGRPITTLESWPDTTKSLITFDPPVPTEIAFLKDAFCLPNYNTWLFKVGGDAIAGEVKSGCVRPSNSYIILVKERPDFKELSCCEIDISCKEIRAYAIEIPAHITHEIESDLSSIGLSTSHTLQLEPVGIVPKIWDDEGFGHWLPNDKIILSLRSSLPIVTYSLRLNREDGIKEATLDIQVSDASTKAYIKLPSLKTGDYSLEILATVKDEAAQEMRTLGKAIIRVDDIIAEDNSNSSTSPVVILSNPTSPDFEDLWFGRASLHILGPPGQAVKPTMKLFDGTGNCITSKNLPKLTLPVTPRDWRVYLRNRVPDREVEPLLDRAYQCHLTFDAANLGKYVLFCQRHILPIRWSLTHHGKHMKVSLVDHTSTVENVSFFPCSQPMRKTLCKTKTFTEEPIEWEKQGLFLAVSKEHNQQDSIIIVPNKGYFQPGEFRIRSKIDRIERNSPGITRSLDIITIWSNARVRDTISAIQRHNILKLLHRTLFRVISGSPWIEREKQSDRIENTRECVRNLRNGLNMPIKNGAERFARDMASAHQFLYCFSPQDRAEYMSFYLERIWNFNYSLWLAEFIMRLASSPESIRSWVKGNDMLQYGLKRVLRMPFLLRIARMFVIGVHRECNVNSHKLSDVPIYAGWNWDY